MLDADFEGVIAENFLIEEITPRNHIFDAVLIIWSMCYYN